MMNIGIIGGGITGLVAGYQLLQSGHNVTIFEKDQFTGGLASGIELYGTTIERAYHHVFAGEKDIINLLEDLQIESGLKWYTSTQGILTEKRFHDFSTPVDILKFTPLPFWDRIMLFITGAKISNRKSSKHFRDITAVDWLKKNSSEKVFQTIWKSILQSKFHDQYKSVAMSWVWARLHTRINSRSKSRFKEVLGYMDGGFKTFIDKLVSEIRSMGGNILTSSHVTSITSSRRVRVQTSRGVKQFDKLIATVPSRIFAEMVAGAGTEAGYLQSLRSIKYLGAATLLFSSKQDLNLSYWNTILDRGAPFSVVIQHTKLVTPEMYKGRDIYYLGGYFPIDDRLFTAKESEITSAWLDELKHLIPQLDCSQIEDKRFFRFKYAQHVVDTGYEENIPKVHTPIRNVYLANFSQVYPWDRGMNQAVQLGKYVAANIG